MFMEKDERKHSGDRLVEALELSKVKTKELGEQLGIDPQRITNWKRRGVPGSMLTKTADALRVNRIWLETGKGSPHSLHLVKETTPSYYTIDQLSPWDDETPVDDDEVELPLYKEVELASGSGKTAVHEDATRKLRFSRATLRQCGVVPENAVFATNTGYSNHPLILHGATIGIDRGMTKVIDDEPYAIDHDGQLRVKFLRRIPGGGLRMRSFNTAEHPDEDYTGDDIETRAIRILGRVFWWSSIRAVNAGPLL